MSQVNGIAEANTIKEIDDIIHKEIIPIQSSFKSYCKLLDNPSFHFSSKHLVRCIKSCEKLVDIARRLTLYERTS